MSTNTAIPITNQTELEVKLQGGVSFYMPAPGVSLAQIDTFFIFLESKVFNGNSIGLTDLLPVSLASLQHIFIQSLSFSPPSATDLYHLSFTLAMENEVWEVIPNLLIVENIAVKIDIYGPIVTANLYGTLAIKDLEFDVAIELPSGYLSAQLKTNYDADGKAIASTASAKGAFDHFKLPHIGKANEYPKLDAFKILASPRARQMSLSMAMSNINIGPMDMALQLALDYAGHPKGHLTGSFWGAFKINKASGSSIDLMVSAKHEAPESGWQFEGVLDVVGEKMQLSDFVEYNIKPFTGSDTSLPPILSDADLELKSIHVSFDSKTKNFKFNCKVDATGLFGKGTTVDLLLQFELSRSENSGATPAYTYTKTINGQVILHIGKHPTAKNLEFDLAFTTDGTTKAFVAVYSNLAGDKIAIDQLIKAFDSGSSLSIPMKIDLKEVFFAFVKDSPTTSKYLFGIDVDSGINLAQLPLVGNILKPTGGLKLALQPIVTSKKFTAAEVQTIVDLIPGGKVSLPAKAIEKGVDLACKLQIGTTTIQLDLPIEMGEDNKTIKGNKRSVALAVAPAVPATTGESGSSPAPAGDVHWFPVQKGFGPVYFNRIGVQFKKGTSEFWFLLDTELTAGPLTLTLDGLGVGSKLQPLSPEFSLNGLGLDYQSGPLEIGGNFLRTTATDSETGEKYDEYDGLAILKMEALNISALGSYARVRGETSLFIYATLDYPIGGPSFFFVEGLALGFGYNRQLKMPPIGDVATFPLVSAAMNGGALPSGTTDRGTYLQNQLNELREYIPPHHGEYFLAVGVHFSSFQLIDSFVLVSVSFGEHFEVDLLGLSRLVIPTPEGGESVTPLAVGELAIKAAFDPERGFLGVQAQLTNNSYILSHQCHLSGGFAFFSWFKDDTLTAAKAGDFVLSLGGYHPAFKPPAYYPHVPRLGYNWRISSDLSIKGGMYFALTPKVLMAGGHMEANFDNGHVRAWFSASADFIVYWKPYHYDARFHIDVGGKVWIFKFDAGADVHLWGPEFAGVATIDCSVVSFTVHFGNSSPSARPISWDKFYSSFLPSVDKVCTTAVEHGLVKKHEVKGDPIRYIINPKEFSMVTNSVVPITAIYKGTPASKKATGITADAFGIAPMNLDKVTSSDFYVNITRDGDDANADFTLSKVNKGLPVAMWGDKFQPDLNGDTLVDTLAGLRITPAKPPTPGSTQAIEKSNLKYSINFIDNAFGFETIAPFSFAHSTEINDRASIKKTITDSAVTASRNDLLTALGMQSEIVKTKLSPDVADDFVEAPLVGAFSI